MFTHGQSVTRLRAQPTTDPYSQGARTSRDEDWSNPDRVLIEGAWVASSSSVSRTDATRRQVITDKSLYCQSDADVRAGDRIVDGPDTYTVDARPSADQNPFTGWQPVMECPLVLVEG